MNALAPSQSCVSPMQFDFTYFAFGSSVSPSVSQSASQSASQLVSQTVSKRLSRFFQVACH